MISTREIDDPAGRSLGNAALAQVLGSVAAALVVLLFPVAQEQPLLIALLQGALAAMASRLLHAPVWWLPIHLLFVPMALLAQRTGLPPGLWLACFVVLLLVFWRTDRSQVPLYLTNSITAQAVAGQLPSLATQVIDLGCGEGGLIRALAKQRPDCRFTGFEHAPLTWAIARLRTRHLPNVDIRFGSFWNHSLREYGMVYAFLSPAPMPRLWEKARKEMRPDAVLISNSFLIPGVEPDGEFEVDDRRRTRLYYYRPGVIHARRKA